ncbi:MAG: AAA family ATPase [Chloroflexota bacterium]
MSTLTNTLTSYLPAIVTQSLEKNPTPINAPSGEVFPAAVLFADFSDFTALSIQMSGLGPGGAGSEMLTQLFNSYFDQLIQVITAHGGDIVKFAGDAIIAVWPATKAHLGYVLDPASDASDIPMEGEEVDPLSCGEDASGDDSYSLSSDEQYKIRLQRAILQAVQCSKTMLSQVDLNAGHLLSGDYETLADKEVHLRISIAAGDIFMAHLGGLYGRWELLVSGEPMVEIGTANNLRRTNEIVMSPSAWNLVHRLCKGTALSLLPTMVGGLPWGAKLDEVLVDVSFKPTFVPHPSSEAEATLRAYIPGAVRERLTAGQANWLAELRFITVIFIHLPELSHITPLSEAQTIMQAVQHAIYRYEGSINKLSVDDKGTTLIAGMGLPPLAHEDDAQRAICASVDILSSLQDLGLYSAIGIATGRVYCGLVGNEQRHEYTMMGDVMNIAARLMQAAPGEIYCDEITYQLAKNTIPFEILEPITVKGKTEIVPIYSPEVGTFDDEFTTTVGYETGASYVPWYYTANNIPQYLNGSAQPYPPRRHTFQQPYYQFNDIPLVSLDGDAPTNGQQSSEEKALPDTIIGRDRELSILFDAVDALQEGVEQSFLLTGETGIGKTLLLNAVQAHLDNATEEYTTLWASGHVISETQPYHVWLPLLIEILGLHTADTKKFAGAQQGAVLAHLYTTDSSLIEWAALLNDLFPLDLPESQRLLEMVPEERSQKRCFLLSQLICQAMQKKPLVLLLDDVQWFDSESLRVLETIVASEARPQCLIIMAARYSFAFQSEKFRLTKLDLEQQTTPVSSTPVSSTPVSSTPVSSTPVSSTPVSLTPTAVKELQLSPLSKENIERLLCQRWQVRAFESTIIDFIYQRTQGYPLYSKGVADTLLSMGKIQIDPQQHKIIQTDSAQNGFGIKGTHLPYTVQNVITSQLDQLSPQLQLTLKVASVIGAEFNLDLLYDVYPLEQDKPTLLSSIQHLVDDYWIQPQMATPLGKPITISPNGTRPEPQTYQFRLAVVQEVAYNLMSIAQRRQLERAIEVYGAVE